jgi:nicotinic acid mononucleotide adenylyltransferase
LTTLPPILQKQWEENKVVINALEISSTEIRQRIAEKRTLRYLVPDEVINYIETVDFTIT